MKIVVFPQDNGGCGNYRMRWPGQAVKALGHDVVVLEKWPQVIVDRGKVIGFAQRFEADIVVIQRPARTGYLDIIDLMHARGSRVVVDMDDDLSCIHPLNPAFIPYQQKDMHWQFAIEACEKADLVTCSTEALAERYGPGHSVVLPNCIPEWYLNVAAVRDERTTVGWAGLTATHPKDLDITHGAVNQALAMTKEESRFMAIGDDKTFYKLGIKQRAPHVFVPGVPMVAYPTALAKLDIGIVPLETSKFNDAKSWLKALEYAACGVVPVVSPTPDNLKMVEAGAAVSASSPAEWADKLKSLIQNDQDRKALTESAKDFARKYTIEANAERWWDAWSSIM